MDDISIEEQIENLFSQESIDIEKIILDSIKIKYKKPLTDNEIKTIEKEFNFSCGTQLKYFLKTYGYITINYFEICGLENIMVGTRFYRNDIESDLKIDPIVKKCIAIASPGNGDDYLIDENDNIYYFNHESPENDVTKLRKLPGSNAAMKFDSWIDYQIKYILTKTK